MSSRLVSVSAGVVAALWAVLAWMQPDTTFHAAPIVVAAALPVTYRIRSGPLPTQDAAAMAIAGIIVVAVVTGGLAWSNKLGGPSILPFGGAATEGLILGFAGGVVGAAIASFEP